jgi:hypothetical protein
VQALVRFANVAAGNTFTTAELYPRVLAALGSLAERYSLASFRYDLTKLRAKRLVAKLPRSRRYQLLPQGYSICLIFLKLFDRVYAPLTAGVLSPVTSDSRLDPQKRSHSTASTSASSTMSTSSFTPSASKPHDKPPNENKIHLATSITV